MLTHTHTHTQTVEKQNQTINSHLYTGGQRTLLFSERQYRTKNEKQAISLKKNTLGAKKALKIRYTPL